ncbi:MAG: tRNA (adenosine(37)-N6)-threonylcarbamoyltransferase complex ATPase subunit type 1 TsaE [Methylobacteriaceae bacterium]|nr:tRNA (adenosine(37)-N6)-threonylcarbamoyltransferase complex ATPase subunit type 1 TsaE [Methylobacteriaceae bacterium]
MALREPIDPVWPVDLPDEAATIAFARRIARLARPGMLLTLSGDLGAGKTTFARALVRALAQEPDLEVPSPTFTLMQVYETPAFPIVHADLYRLRDSSELAELGWDEAGEGALLVVEWAERAGDLLPADRLEVMIALAPDQGDGARMAALVGHGAYGELVARERAVAALLDKAGWDEARRDFMLGDASTRAYERLTKADGTTAILMISPPRPDGPPVRYGKPYSAIARLAETIHPFVSVDAALRARGLSAPDIYAADLAAGLALIEDLGGEGVVDANGPIPERYAEATAVLAALHSGGPVEAPDGYRPPAYDLDALLIEVELLTEWYAPHVARAGLSSGAAAVFGNIWRDALAEIVAASAPTSWVLRDFHSPNLLWLPRREGAARIGVIDFQDCVLGHPAYDVASLLQDARVTVSDELELRLLGHYARLRRERDPAFDMQAFARAYAIMGAQRATKILGIFARLDKRDGKPQYLAHLPRVRAYLLKNLRHAALAGVREWFDTYIPATLAAEPAG